MDGWIMGPPALLLGQVSGVCPRGTSSLIMLSLPLDYMLPQDGYGRPCQTRSSTNAGAVSPTRRGAPEDRQKNSVVEKAESSRCLFKFWLCDLGLVA